MKDKKEFKEEPKQARPKFRYACPACTNVAFYSTDKEMIGTVTCQSCGKLISIQKQNYIKL